VSWAFDANGYPTWVPWIVGEPADGDVLTWSAAESAWIPATGGGGGATVTTGSATLAFGASMAQEASVAVTGQTGILVGSKVWAWLVPTATTQHSADEVMVNPPAVFAGNIVAGTGFTIYGNAYNLPGSQAYGDYTVAWAWV
jgi:hypothetical protein